MQPEDKDQNENSVSTFNLYFRKVKGNTPIDYFKRAVMSYPPGMNGKKISDKKRKKTTSLFHQLAFSGIFVYMFVARIIYKRIEL